MTPDYPEAERLRAMGFSDVRSVGEIIEEAAPIGHNNPPTPFDLLRAEIDDLYSEAKNWLDGDGIQNEAQAGEVGKLRDLLRDVAKRADDQRKTEAKPFDDGKAEIQARYNPLIQKDRGLCDIAIQTCNNALKPFLKKKDDEQRAEAEKLRQAALAQAAETREAAETAAASSNIVDREKAEDLISQAANMLRDANRADAAKPQVAGGKRAVGLKSIYTPELVDPAAALAHYRQRSPSALKAWLIEQAKADVRSGQHAPDAIPGFKILEDKVPV